MSGVEGQSSGVVELSGVKEEGQSGVEVEVERRVRAAWRWRVSGVNVVGQHGVEVEGQSSVVVEVERSEGGGSERRVG